MPVAVIADHSRVIPTLDKQHPGLAGTAAAEGFGADNGGLLFKHVTPRRRQDQFGRDSTRHADYLLSMAVFPTGVRAPLLSDLQKKTEHQCGFEIVDKGTERGTGRHVQIQESSNIRRDLMDSSRQGSATDSAKKPPPNTPLTASIKLSCDRATHHSQSISIPPSSHRSLSSEKRRWVHSSMEGGPRSSSLGGGEKKMKDIRDPLYLNTYCPEERKLRYKKSSLPRVSTRARPWTVSEPNPSYRFSGEGPQDLSPERTRGRPGMPVQTSAGHGQAANFRIDARDVMARAKGRAPGQVQGDEEGQREEDTDSVSGNQALLEVKSYFPNADIMLSDQRDALRGKQGCLHAKVKQCIKFVKYREKLSRSMVSVERPLKAESGRYRPFSTTTIRTPRASGPASSSSCPPAPRHPDPISVEIYKEYIDTIALQTRLVSAADKRRRKPRAAVSGNQPRNNTAASSYQDSVTMHSLADSTPTHGSATEKASSSRPSDSSALFPPPPTSSSLLGPSAEKDLDTSRGKDGSDPRGVHQALDIIRLSPKAQPPRSSRTSRGGRSTHREGEGAEEEKKEEEEKGKAKTHAIFLPNVSKSATTSVCSFMEESVTAGES